MFSNALIVYCGSGMILRQGKREGRNPSGVRPNDFLQAKRWVTTRSNVWRGALHVRLRTLP